MKALITGGGGFCGRHLVRYLREQSIETFTLGTRRSESLDHRAIRAIDDSAGIASAIDEIRPDFIFHLAGVSSAEKASLFYRVNVEFATELIDAVDHCGLKGTPLLLVGTAAEYGLIAPENLPAREDYPAHPVSHYGISKFTQTLAGLAAARAGHRVVVVRPSNVIGPGMPPRLLLGRVAAQIARISKGEQSPQVEVGSLDSSRDFIDVRDFVRMCWLLVRAENASGEVVNLSTGTAVPIRAVVERLIDRSGIEAALCSRSATARVDLPIFCADNNKLRRLTGAVLDYDLEGSLDAILSATMSFE